MSDMKHGGAAFPLQSIGVDFMPGHHGMTLRDYFAGQAIIAIIPQCAKDAKAFDESRQEYFARRAYEIADAMLAAREDAA